MLVVSPWSKGGWVNSQLFDHTSIIRFIERRFGTAQSPLGESNISPWRQAVCGDLHSAFDFSRPDASSVSLPSTSGYVPPDQLRHPDYDAVPPANQALPEQEPGLRPARALPYELHATGWADQGNFWIDFASTGKAGACFQVRSADLAGGPWSYTVESGKSIADSWPVTGEYDLAVYSSNGFLRHFKGDLAAPRTNLRVSSRYDRGRGNFELILANKCEAHCEVTVENTYSGESFSQVLAPGERVENHWKLEGSFGWYDLIVRSNAESGFVQRLAGHVETGAHSFSDPAIANTHRLGVTAS
jgi:phospholipase C